MRVQASVINLLIMARKQNKHICQNVENRFVEGGLGRLLRELGAAVSVSVRCYLGLGANSDIKHTGTAGTVICFAIRKTSRLKQLLCT